MTDNLRLGVDIGSTTVKVVIIDKENNIDASVRGTVGEDIKAACGQLRAEII